MNQISSDVIQKLLRTEKGVMASVHGKYIFAVDRNATKPQIKKAVEELFKVKVRDVNTAIVAGKPRRVGANWGYRPEWKRAVVTLAEGSKIEVAV